MMKVLVVDDEKILAKGIKFNLENEGYTVIIAYDGEEALEKAKYESPDIIILDLMLPKMDGLMVCNKIREFSKVPIIMLTAKSDDTDKLIGFEFGADDYITKPFNIMELKARMKAVLRRSNLAAVPADNENLINRNAVSIDISSRDVFVYGEKVDLTVKEFDLLELLVKNPGHVYSRDKLLSIVWGYDYPGDARTVDVHVRRIREKIEKDPANPEFLMTKWGVGYYFKD